MIRGGIDVVRTGSEVTIDGETLAEVSMES